MKSYALLFVIIVTVGFVMGCASPVNTTQACHPGVNAGSSC